MYYFIDKLNVVKSELRSPRNQDITSLNDENDENDDKNYPLLPSIPRID